VADNHGIDRIAEDLLSSEPLLGLGSRLHLDLEDDFGIFRVIDDDNGIVLFATQDSMSSERLVGLGPPLSAWIEDRASKPPGLSSCLSLFDWRSYYRNPGQPRNQFDSEPVSCARLSSFCFLD
jgi:hypothetical protein